ncbi:MAG: hypothetical protein ACXVKH_17200 [Candidatus Angelobacter sp.]
MKTTLAAVVFYFACAVAISAQANHVDSPLGTTTVSGHVFCADTNAPARMATVVLEPSDVIESIKPGEQLQANFSGEAVETLLDGSFIIHNVTPGTYYVIASKQGYIYPVAPLYIRGDQPSLPEDRRKEEPKLAPRIHVQASLPVAVNVTIERGAAVSGIVLFDDGSPASGIHMTLLAHSKDQWIQPPTSPVGQSFFSGYTDDEGHYRITGLPAGEYLLEGALHLSKTTYQSDEHSGTSVSTQSVFSLSVYSGGSTRRKDGTPFSLTKGEERHGVDMEIPLTKLHSVRGNIVAAHDGHVLNGGMLSLLNADDRSLVSRTTVKEDDDTFSFSFVPEGEYILHVDEGSDNEYRKIRNSPGSFPPTRTETHTLRRYGPSDQPIRINGEVTDMYVAVPELEQKSTSKR